ncbi:hypothetical protein ACWIT3_01150 [Pasteurella sp. P03HT]
MVRNTRYGGGIIIATRPTAIGICKPAIPLNQTELGSLIRTSAARLIGTFYCLYGYQKVQMTAKRTPSAVILYRI